VNAYSVSRKGVGRKVNQDSLLCEMEPVGKLPNLFLVADGMGGYNGGDFASGFTVDHMKEYIEHAGDSSLISTLKNAISDTNSKLRAKAEELPELKGCGTTLVASVIEGDCVHVANIGDSRLYLLQGGNLRQITEDHSVVEALVKKGELKRSEARFASNKNVITRALGSEPVVEADFFEVPIEDGTRIFMCTDGVSNMMDDRTMESILNEYKNPVDACTVLVNTARDNGGRDDATAMIIDI